MYTWIFDKLDSFRFAKGLLDIPIEYDEASERYFDQFRYSRSALPDSYNAVTEGFVVLYNRLFLWSSYPIHGNW